MEVTCGCELVQTCLYYVHTYICMYGPTSAPPHCRHRLGFTPHARYGPLGPAHIIARPGPNHDHLPGPTRAPGSTLCHSARTQTDRLHARLGSYVFTQFGLTRLGSILGSAHIIRTIGHCAMGTQLCVRRGQGVGGSATCRRGHPTIPVGGNGPASARVPGFDHWAGHVRTT